MPWDYRSIPIGAPGFSHVELGRGRLLFMLSLRSGVARGSNRGQSHSGVGPVEESLVATNRAGRHGAVEREGQRWSRRCITPFICSPLIDERDEMIVKALSWALRALVARDPEAVRQVHRRKRRSVTCVGTWRSPTEAGDRAKESEIVSTQSVQLVGAMRLAVLHRVFIESH
jgi:hypothetical protein